MRKEGEETEVGKIVKESKVYESVGFSVIERVIQTPEGKVRAPHFLWDRKGKRFSVVVALTDKGEFLLLLEPKYGQMQVMLMLPAGGVKKEESPMQAAKRELKEETGYESNNWSSLRDTPVIDFPDKIDGGEHYFFLATGAWKSGKEEAGRKLLLFTRDEIEKILDDSHPKFHLNSAMAIAALGLAIRQP